MIFKKYCSVRNKGQLLVYNTCFGSISWQLKWCFTDFIVQQNKRLLLFLVRQKISKICRRKMEDFLRTLFLENKEKTCKKKYRMMFSTQLKMTCKNSGTYERKKKHSKSSLGMFCTHPFDCLNTNLHQVFYKNKPDFIPATATLTSSSDVKAATAELQELVSFWQTSSTEKSKVKRHKKMFLLYNLCYEEVKLKSGFIYSSTCIITSIIIHMKKLLNSDWLRAVQFKCETSAKSVTAEEITGTHCNSGLWLAERQWEIL